MHSQQSHQYKNGLLSPGVYDGLGLDANHQMRKNASSSSSTSSASLAASSIVVTEDDTIQDAVAKNLRILVVGDPKCGKSSVVNRYVTKHFDPELKTNRGIETVKKRLALTLPGGGGQRLGILLSIMDAAGQERLTQFAFPNLAIIHGVVIVCDVSREGTVESVRAWKERIDKWAEGRDPPLPIVLFANKSDLLSGRQESARMGELIGRICRDHSLLGTWTSAQTGDCLDDGFTLLVQRMAESEYAEQIRAHSRATVLARSVAENSTAKNRPTIGAKSPSKAPPSTTHVTLPTWLLLLIATLLLATASTYCYTSLALARQGHRGERGGVGGADEGDYREGEYDSSLGSGIGRQQQEQLVSMLLSGGLDAVFEAAQEEQEEQGGYAGSGGAGAAGGYAKPRGVMAKKEAGPTVGTSGGGSVLGYGAGSSGSARSSQARRYKRTPLIDLLEALQRLRQALFGWLSWNPFRGSR